MNAPDRNNVRDVFLMTLREFLGENAPAEITEATDPFNDLGLDSEDGVDFACVLSEKFGCKVPDDVNPLVDDARHCSRRLGDAIDLMCVLIQKGAS
jgi:acyl carrier protein